MALGDSDGGRHCRCEPWRVLASTPLAGGPRPCADFCRSATRFNRLQATNFSARTMTAWDHWADCPVESELFRAAKLLVAALRRAAWPPVRGQVLEFSTDRH